MECLSVFGCVALKGLATQGSQRQPLKFLILLYFICEIRRVWGLGDLEFQVHLLGSRASCL